MMASANDPMSKQSELTRLALDRKTIETKRVYAGFNICLSPLGLAFGHHILSIVVACGLLARNVVGHDEKARQIVLPGSLIDWFTSD
jgi:hypothetical protein